MRNLLSASHNADLIDSADLRRKPTVNAQHLAVNNGSQNQKIEDLTAGLPDAGITVLLLALFIKPVDLRDLARFVVTTDEDDAIGVSGAQVSHGTPYACQSCIISLCLQAHKEGESLQTEITSIDEIAQEDKTHIGAVDTRR